MVFLAESTDVSCVPKSKKVRNANKWKPKEFPSTNQLFKKIAHHTPSVFHCETTLVGFRSLFCPFTLATHHLPPPPLPKPPPRVILDAHVLLLVIPMHDGVALAFNFVFCVCFRFSSPMRRVADIFTLLPSLGRSKEGDWRQRGTVQVHSVNVEAG